MIIRSHFVPIEGIERDLIARFVLSNWEEQFLIPDWIKRMSNDSVFFYTAVSTAPTTKTKST